jgi:hypothetical protein
MLLRLAFYVVVAFVVWALVGAIVARLRPRLRAVRRPAAPAAGAHDWERRTRQLYRAWKHVPTPGEDREAIVAWLSSHDGVEAYMEPRTVMSALSVVLVDGQGDWKRFELADDSFVRALASEHRLPVFDAGRVGYPPRMRRRPPAAD